MYAVNKTGKITLKSVFFNSFFADKVQSILTLILHTVKIYFKLPEFKKGVALDMQRR